MTGTYHRTMRMCVAAAAVLSMCVGCAAGHRQQNTETLAAAQAPQAPEPVYRPPVTAEGSLWGQEARMLYTDAKARRVGDTVTIDIVEISSSKMDATTSTGRTSSVDVGVDHALGYMRALEASNKLLGKDSDGNQTTKLFKAATSNSFKGQGTSDRSGSITASIGARVVEVLSNGNLLLYGRRQMKVNSEVQYIVASGVVRPEDIDSDNRVQSTYLADARIEMLGKGVIADKQRPGWGTRVLDFVWPF